MGALTEFLLARIAERKARAQAVIDSHALWDWGSYVAAAGMYDEPASDYAERMTPEREVARCEADRQIVMLHPEFAGGYCGTCADDGPHYARGMIAWPCPTLRALAAVYADHPDYEEVWRP